MESDHIDATAKTLILTVLLVEDSQVLVERLSEAVRQTANVLLIGTVATEEGALAILQREHVDVLILDLHLRQGTGFGVMRALSKTPASSPKPTIIVLTNYDLPEYKSAAMSLGAKHFLDKARDYGHLPELLRAASPAMSTGA